MSPLNWNTFIPLAMVEVVAAAVAAVAAAAAVVD
jgi:hypothetical protein